MLFEDGPIKIEKLDNGLTVITRQHDGIDAIVSLNVEAGPGNERKSDPRALPIGAKAAQSPNPGIAHVLEHVLFDEEADKEATEKFGGVINASTYANRTMISSVLENKESSVLQAIELIGSRIQSPKFSHELIDREVRAIDGEIDLLYQVPADKARCQMYKIAYPHSFLSNDITGTITDVHSITKPMLHEFIENEYTPNRMTLVVASDADHNEVMGSVRKTLGMMPEKNNLPLPPPKYLGGQRVEEDSRQPDIAFRMFFPTPDDYKKQDPYTSKFMNKIIEDELSRGDSSPLKKHTRMLGYAYRIYADTIDANSGPGIWIKSQFRSEAQVSIQPGLLHKTVLRAAESDAPSDKPIVIARNKKKEPCIARKDTSMVNGPMTYIPIDVSRGLNDNDEWNNVVKKLPNAKNAVNGILNALEDFTLHINHKNIRETKSYLLKKELRKRNDVRDLAEDMSDQWMLSRNPKDIDLERRIQKTWDAITEEAFTDYVEKLFRNPTVVARGTGVDQIPSPEFIHNQLKCPRTFLTTGHAHDPNFPVNVDLDWSEDPNSPTRAREEGGKGTSNDLQQERMPEALRPLAQRPQGQKRAASSADAPKIVAAPPKRSRLSSLKNALPFKMPFFKRGARDR